MNLIFSINTPIDIVFSYLTDMQKFVSAHPLITKIDALTDNNYIIHERVKILGLPIRFTYPVTVEHDFEAKKITMRATIMKLTKVEMNYQLTKEGDKTIIKETITIKSYLPIKWIMRRIFRKQHGLLFENIEKISLAAL